MPRKRLSGAGALSAAGAALFWLPGAALAPPQPRFTCPWSPSAAALCLAYDAQSLAAASGDPQPTRRGFLTTVVPATPAGEGQPSYGVAPTRRNASVGRPAYAVVVQGNFSNGPAGERSAGWLVAFVERATGRLLRISGPGVKRLSDVIPAGAGPFHPLQPPPRWAAACAVRALQRSELELVIPLLRARQRVRGARTTGDRGRALLALRRLQAQVGTRADLIAAHTCS